MSRQIKQHSISYTTSVARRAAADITHFLQTALDYTVAVHNVEEVKAYQQYDIDLLWTILEKNERLRTIYIEIKGDSYHHTGNFFFETISNATKGTLGCFLYTRADWLFYYFVEIGHLYCLPMDKVRPWFEANIDRFKEQPTSTPVGSERYITIGRLVPIQTVLDEVSGILHYIRQEETWIKAV